MFQKILIVESGKDSKTHLETIEKVRDILNSKEFNIKKSDELEKTDFENLDLVLTIGGDGTFIKAAHYIINETPILGINSEPEFSEGYLKSIKNNELEKLKEILNGNFKIIKRQRAKIIHNNKEIEFPALNDVYIGSAYQFHTSRYDIEFKGKTEEHRSSGVVVSTGTGSTAWFESAGGNTFNFEEEKLQFIVREPYTGNIYNPTILKGEINPGEELTIKSKRTEGGIIALDSNRTFEFDIGCIVKISPSKKPLNVIIYSEKFVS
ncbi:MAG: NAD(+)/NADH kinase [Nanoarchaeota archaeon]|nr:NAD(+)/NADH kinase [Nanoarchaeota archaeon]